MEHYSFTVTSVQPLFNGANNTTSILETTDGRYVCRVYETHQDERRVQFEHAVLQHLAAQPLSFAVPRLVKTTTGATYTKRTDGKLVVVTRYMEGTNPYLTTAQQCRDFARITLQLATALQTFTGETAAYLPYYRFDESYKGTSLHDVLPFCENAEQKAAIEQFIAEFTVNQAAIMALPHQFIHADLNASNLLAIDGQLSAVLDFEFVSYDVRLMEFAICLSDLLRQVQKHDVTEEESVMMLQSFSAELGPLTSEEKRLLPLFMLLRRFDVVLHFTHLYRTKTNRNEAETRARIHEQLTAFVFQARWLAKYSVC